MFPRSHEFMAYHLQPSTYHLKPITYNLKLQPTTFHRQGGSGKLHFLQFKFLESNRPSSSPVELPGTMLSMKFCIEWCRGQGLLSLETSKNFRFWVLGFQGFATYPNFKVLGFQGLATNKILRCWVFRVSLHIKILRSWVSRVLRHNTILRSWVSRVPRQKGRARSKIRGGELRVLRVREHPLSEQVHPLLAKSTLSKQKKKITKHHLKPISNKDTVIKA